MTLVTLLLLPGLLSCLVDLGWALTEASATGLLAADPQAWDPQLWLSSQFEAPAWLFDNFMFRRWQGHWLQKGPFKALTTGLKIGLSLTVAGLWMAERRARRLGFAPKQKTARAIGLFITACSFLLYFDFFNPNARYEQYYHRHEFYHYYMGSKYFEEVDYGRLYGCTAIAESELRGPARMRDREIRDLSARNLTVPVPETYVFKNPKHCKQHFSDERWAAFKRDIKWFERSSRGSYWNGMQTDHGYNPPPVWTMTGKLLADLAPAGDAFFKLLALLDVGLQLGAVGLLGWAFGWRIMMLATVFWACNAPASFYWTGGAFLRQDWIFLLIASVSLARKRKFVLSGAALTWTGLLRVFPLAYFGGVGLVMLLSLLRNRKVHRDHWRFLAGCALCAGVLLPTSLMVTGPEAYPAFAKHIGLHKNTPLTNHMGLETMLSHHWDGRMVFKQDDREDDPFEPWMAERLRRKDTLKPVAIAVNLGLIGWLAWALRRTRRLWVGIALTTPLIPALTNLTCYYYSIFLLIAPLARSRPGLAPAYLAVAGASQVLLGRFYWIDDRYTAQSYLFFAFGLCVYAAFGNPWKLERLRAWWRRREPEKSATVAAE